MGVIAWLLWNQLTAPVRVVPFPELAQPSPKPTARPEISQPPPPTAHMPGTLRMLISEGNEKLARMEFEKYLRTASRLEARGTVLLHLDDGHLLVKGSVGNPKTRGINYQTYLLFGLPEADRLADGDTFDAFVVMGDAIETSGGDRTREYIFVNEGGRRPVPFARNSGIYD